MHLNIGKEVAALQRMTVKELREKYADTFGEETNANNKAWLVKRIAWRLQALAEGDLSERARRRAAELANDADLRLSPPKAKQSSAEPERTRTTHLQFKWGRLVLNVLLSFAQFEREIISERTRDKIAATRRKGEWAGGHPILGYD